MFGRVPYKRQLPWDRRTSGLILIILKYWNKVHSAVSLRRCKADKKQALGTVSSSGLCCFIRMHLFGYQFITYNQILHTVHNWAVEKEMTTRLWITKWNNGLFLSWTRIWFWLLPHNAVILNPNCPVVSWFPAPPWTTDVPDYPCRPPSHSYECGSWPSPRKRSPAFPHAGSFPRLAQW